MGVSQLVAFSNLAMGWGYGKCNYFPPWWTIMPENLYVTFVMDTKRWNAIFIGLIARCIWLLLGLNFRIL